MGWEPIDDIGRKIILRKRKQCEWCNQWLEKGSQAVLRVYKFDGEYNSARMHPECYDAMVESLPNMWDGEFEPGNQDRGCLIGKFEQARKG